MSFFRIDSGTVQVGLRLTAVMLVVSVGDGPVDLADHRDVAPRHLAVLDRLGDRGRDVHHHVTLAEGEIHAGEPVERGRELAQALRYRHVERLERLRADRAGLGRPWRIWKRLTASVSIVVVARRPRRLRPAGRR